MAIQEGNIVIHKFVLGDRDVRVISINRAMNTAVIQFKELDKPITPQNTYTVTIDTLREKNQ